MSEEELKLEKLKIIANTYVGLNQAFAMISVKGDDVGAYYYKAWDRIDFVWEEFKKLLVEEQQNDK